MTTPPAALRRATLLEVRRRAVGASHTTAAELLERARAERRRLLRPLVPTGAPTRQPPTMQGSHDGW